MEFNLKKKNNSKKKIVFLVLTIVMFLGISLASVYFLYFFNDQRENSLTTALISIDFNEGTEVINLENTVPVLDEVGLLNTPYEFTVKNTSKVPINLKIQLEVQSETTIPLGAVKYAFYIDNELKIIDNVKENDNDGLYIHTNFPKNSTVSCKLIFWVDYYYENPGETFSAKIKVTGESFDIIYEVPTLVEQVKSNLLPHSVIASNDFNGGLVAVNGTEGDDHGLLYNENNPNHTIREYRYSGLETDNYIYFNCPDDASGENYDYANNCELWRIIGVFEENGEEYTKIVKVDALSDMPDTYNYNDQTYTFSNSCLYIDSDYDNWLTGKIQYYLNTEHDNSETPVPGYLSKLSTKSKDLLKDTTYYLGDFYSNYYVSPAFDIYNNERATEYVWNGKVSLLYPSDYLYSLDPAAWSGPPDNKLVSFKGKNPNSLFLNHKFTKNNNNLLFIAGYDAARENAVISFYSDVGPFSWFYDYYYTNEKISYDDYYMFLNYRTLFYLDVYSSGGVALIEAAYEGNCHKIFPSVTLKSTTKYLKGDGTLTNPYVVIQ